VHAVPRTSPNQTPTQANNSLTSTPQLFLLQITFAFQAALQEYTSLAKVYTLFRALSVLKH
jgi:hypothetical protein